MKIAYAGFDLLYPVLENLYNNGCEITKIFTCDVDNVTEFNTKTIAFANKHNIEITSDRITKTDLDDLKKRNIDALFCAAYYFRIPVTSDFAMINVHPTLLPDGRGAWPMPIYILNGTKTTGVTFHKMSENFDDGDIVLQKSFELTDTDNHDTYMQKIYDLLPDMVGDLLENFDYYLDNAKKQGAGEYLQCPDEDSYVISEETNYLLADKITRAFYGFFVTYDDRKTQHKLVRVKAYKGDNKNEKYKIKDGYLK